MILVVAPYSIAQSVVIVDNPIAFTHAVERARPGTIIKVHPGVYNGRFAFKYTRGNSERPITITANDPARPPVFHGQEECLKFENPAWLVLDNLVLEGARVNGLNIDDGGRYRNPASHVTLRNLRIRNIGRGGNNEAIKPSGVDYMTIEDCTVEDWGSGDGQGIDMVGCHRVLIENCAIGRGNKEQKSVGIQAKGGSADVTIRRCRFVQAGERAVQIGGTTGPQFFRPQANQRFEAERVVVEGCRFIGGETAVAFVGCVDSAFRFNTVYHPRAYLMRILSEDPGPDSDDTQRNAVTDNIFVFDAGSLHEPFNTSAGHAARHVHVRPQLVVRRRPPQTQPRSDPGRRDIDGVYGTDPKVTESERGVLSLKPDSPAKAAGADAMPADKTPCEDKPFDSGTAHVCVHSDCGCINTRRRRRGERFASTSPATPTSPASAMSEIATSAARPTSKPRASMSSP